MTMSVIGLGTPADVDAGLLRDIAARGGGRCFFTTKPEGSGIGLVLSRQIAEAHGGSLTLGNRSTPPGARALLRLPAEDPSPSLDQT